MIYNVVPLIPDAEPIQSSNAYVEHGFDGDDATAQRLLHLASRLDGAIEQAWQFKLMQGEALTEAKELAPRFFGKWLEIHRPEMSRSKVARLMAVYRHRHELSPFMDDDGDFSPSGKNNLSFRAAGAIAEAGAPTEVIDEVRERLAAGQQVTESDVLHLNRQVKAKRTGRPPSPRPLELQALTMYRKARTADTEAALLLARQITTVSEADLLAELGLRELPKAKVLHAMEADFHRRPDGSGWDRVPHSGRVEIEQQASPDPEPLSPPAVLTAAEAAEILGVKESSLKNMLTPSRAPDGYGMVGGRKVKRHGPNAYVLL